MTSRDTLVNDFVAQVEQRNPHQPEFLQAVRELAEDVLTIEKNSKTYAKAKVLERLTEPDRMIAFRVTWMDDAGDIHVNRGWRVQTSNAIGPYKGGLRFHPSVNPSILKFLGFEQVFKNALTGLPLGGGKGGSDFDPSGRSNAEIMRFCQAFMTELSRYIGPDVDVPAGDINVGPREIGYLFGAYKALQGQFNGAITGKGLAFGGSEMRVEATGFGLIYFVSCMLAEKDEDISDKRIAISGKGNVATHAALRAIKDGARVITLSDTSGTLVAPDGMTAEAVSWVQERKAAGEDVSAPPKTLNLTFEADSLPWAQDVDIALPCATQNEMDEDAAQMIVDNGVSLLAEGANMPLTRAAIHLLNKAGVRRAPGKAANAGGVAISGLEMSQNALGRFHTAATMDDDLRDIMKELHARVAEEGRDGSHIDYGRGANIAGYRKVADAISAFGAV